MPCQVPPIQIGAACQPCTGREGLSALARRRSHMLVDDQFLYLGRPLSQSLTTRFLVEFSQPVD